VPLTGILRVWLTIYVLIWPALLVVAADWAFGSAAATTSVVFLIACLWAFLRYRRVSKRIFTVTTRRKRARR
jgi:hypothetical protein